MGKIVSDYSTPNRIRELREKKGLTQQQLAEKLNLSASSVGHYENGRRVIDYTLARKIAKILETDYDYLMGLSDVETIAKDNYINILIETVSKLNHQNRHELLGYAKCLLKHQ